METSVGIDSQFQETGNTLRFIATAEQQDRANEHRNQALMCCLNQTVSESPLEQRHLDAEKVYMQPTIYEIHSAKTKTFSNHETQRIQLNLGGRPGQPMNMMLIRDSRTDQAKPIYYLSVPIKSPDVSFKGNPASR